MSTIRFEDLGKPIQALLKGLKGGYTEEDMNLMEYVSVKDMAKVRPPALVQKKIYDDEKCSHTHTHTHTHTHEHRSTTT